MFKERHRESGKRQLKVVKMVNERNLLGRAIPTSPLLSASGVNLVFPSLKIQSLGETAGNAVKICLDLENDLAACRWTLMTLQRNMAPACKHTDLA